MWGGYDRPVVAAVPSGLSHTPLIILKNDASSSALDRPVHCCTCQRRF
jgi:hypothetical protein